MDDLLQGAEELKTLLSNFNNHLKTSQANEIQNDGIDSLIDDYLIDYASEELPESLEKALFIGETSFTPPSEDKVDEAIKTEAERLIRVELAELAQDAVALKIVDDCEDVSAPLFLSEEEIKRIDYIQDEIRFALKAEAAIKNPAILTNPDAEPIVEPRNEEGIAKNSALVNSFFEEIEKARANSPHDDGLLDLKHTFVPPYVPKIDPISFAHGLIAQNVFTINLRPIINENAEVTDMVEVWEKPLDVTAIANSMQPKGPATSTLHQLKGNGLEIPLEIARDHNLVDKVPTQDDFDEVKYAEMQVILELDHFSTGRWPQIIERKPTEEVVEETKVAPAMVMQTDDVFKMMDLLTTTSDKNETAPEIKEELTDISSFVKKKKKAKKPMNPEEAIPAEALEKTKIFGNEKSEEKEAFKPKMGSGYEFAEMLDVKANVAEYAKMKQNLARTYPFELDPFQQQAIVAMENGNSVFVAAHTSAGKTVVAEYAIALSRKHRSRVVYTSPIKALSNQKFRDFKNQFGDVGLVTGDIQLNTDATCLVMTTEILKSMLYNGRVSPDELEWVIFDEVHYINDAERGHVWEEVLIMLPIQVNIVMLSATVPNCLEFADWVGRIKNRKIYVVQTLYRPVPLAHHLYSGKDKKSQTHCFEIMGRDGEMNTYKYNKAKEAQIAQWSTKKGAVGNTNKTYFSKAVDRCHYQTLIAYMKEKSLLPAVAFIFSRNRCNEYSQMLHSIDLTSNDEKAAVRKLFTKYLDSFKGSDRNLPQVLQMQELCHRGFAIHHSGILPILKELVEILFQKGYVKFLFATETFAMGVNMPARTVVFDSIEKFDGNSRRPMNCTEYIQMAGRAGRRGIDDTGLVIILSKGREPYDYNALLPMMKGSPVALESKFRITYNMLLNIIRAEQLNIEDMLRRSYVERVSLRHLASRKEQITETQEKLSSLPTLACHDCTPEDYDNSIMNYHDIVVHYIRERSRNVSELIKTRAAANQIQMGRYLLVSYPEKNIPCMLACIHSFINTAERTELNLVTFQTPLTENTGENDLDLRQKIISRESLLFYHAVTHGPETIINNNQISNKLECFKNFPLENIIAICKKKSKFMSEKELNEYFDQQNATTTRRAPSPSRNVTSLMTEMDSVTRSAMQKGDENFLYKIGEDLTTKEIDFHQRLSQYSKFHNQIMDENAFPCRNCIDFENHIRITRERRLLEDELDHLKHQTSSNALLLADNYANCLNVLRELNFIDSDNIITIKGRVAAQINEDTLLLTEMIFDNKLQQRGCSEIAAMLCPLTAQHYASKDKANERDCKIKTSVANIDVINTLKTEVETMANKIDLIERKYSVSESRREEPTFGLMEAVYQWAEGMSFEQITHLTDAHEGIIVRCIQRLDEVLKDIRNAGRIIGDTTLVQKMADTSAAIRRDIVFAASLYTTED